MLGLRRRFEQETTYTRVGPVLMAVNPNRVLPEKPGPHVTDVALAAMRGAVDEGRSQAVVISGESGAGKTVSATKIIEFLISRSSHDTGRKSFERRELAKEELLSRLKASIPALEALGNAGTALNENSSRFGKLVKLTYDGAGRARDVVGAHVEEFLLEKARVARRARGAGERNYHFLCQLAAAAGAGATYAPPATLAAGDADALAATEQSFRDCGVPWDDLKLLRTVGEAVLRLGDDDVDGAARRLSVEPDALRRALAQRTCAGAGVGDADVGVPYEPVERTRVVDALAKALYAALFSAAVAGVNAALAQPLADCRPPGAAGAAGAAAPPPPGTAAFVGILDIYGFEIFAANGLDQLLINFANEVLQRNFDDCLLAAEAARYDADAVPWASLDLARTLKSSAIVDLVTKAPRGLLPLLDEQVKLGNRGSDAAFLTQADKAHRASGVYAKPRLDRNAFVVAHYAGAVTYDPAGFLLSNSDPLPADVAAVFARSANPGVAALVAGASSGDKAAPGGLPSLRDVARASAASHAVVATLAAAAPRKALPQLRESTSRVFRGQMKQLEATLASCAQPAHYVRCVRPNAAKRADRFDAALVLRQLRASGIMDLVKIRALGFPERVSAKAFAEEFAPRADAAEARARDAALAAAGGAGALLEARLVQRDRRRRQHRAIQILRRHRRHVRRPALGQQPVDQPHHRPGEREKQRRVDHVEHGVRVGNLPGRLGGDALEVLQLRMRRRNLLDHPGELVNQSAPDQHADDVEQDMHQRDPPCGAGLAERREHCGDARADVGAQRQGDAAFEVDQALRSEDDNQARRGAGALDDRGEGGADGGRQSPSQSIMYSTYTKLPSNAFSLTVGVAAVLMS